VSRSTAARISKRLRLRARPLRSTIAGGVAWLRLDRPQAGNRITLDLAQALCDAAAEIESDDSVIVVVLTAAGGDFCLGVEAPGAWETQVDWINAIGNLTRPVIAAIQGDALAEGFELALACDLRLVSERARFALPQLSTGRLPAHGGTQRLPRIIGRMRALDLLLTGRTIDAAEAAAMGLAARVVPPKDIDQALDALVSQVKSKGPIALRYAKEAVVKGSDLSLDQGIRLEEDLYVLLQTTHDRQAAIRAFLEKRKPVFRGE
jgi:enoyl-CoA hydratase